MSTLRREDILKLVRSKPLSMKALVEMVQHGSPDLSVLEIKTAILSLVVSEQLVFDEERKLTLSRQPACAL